MDVHQASEWSRNKEADTWNSGPLVRGGHHFPPSCPAQAWLRAQLPITHSLRSQTLTEHPRHARHWLGGGDNADKILLLIMREKNIKEAKNYHQRIAVRGGLWEKRG